MDANPASADLYERLGISPDAKPEDVRAAFRQMRKELHPDSRPESLRLHFDQLMKNVNEANQTLSSPTARAKYDARRTHAQRSQDRQQDAAREQAEGQRQEEARRRQQEADEQRRRREAEAQERRRREEEERRRQEEQARQEEEGGDWWEYVEEPGDGDPRSHEAPEQQPAPPAASSPGAVLHKLPGPLHRAMIYTSGSWLWLGTAVVLWNLPFWGAEFVAALVALAVPVVAGGLFFLTMKAAVVVAPVEKILGFLMPTQGRYSVLWFSRRVIESAVLAPLFIVLAALFSWLWLILSLAAIAYVALWGVEFFRWRRGRQEVGGDRWHWGAGDRIIRQTAEEVETMSNGTRSMWTDWQLWVVIARAYASPLLVLAALCWLLWAGVGGGMVYAGLVGAAACVLVLRDLFAERAETYRQRLEIDRLRAQVSEYDIIIEAEEER